MTKRVPGPMYLLLLAVTMTVTYKYFPPKPDPLAERVKAAAEGHNAQIVDYHDELQRRIRHLEYQNHLLVRLMSRPDVERRLTAVSLLEDGNVEKLSEAERAEYRQRFEKAFAAQSESARFVDSGDLIERQWKLVTRLQASAFDSILVHQPIGVRTEFDAVEKRWRAHSMGARND